MKTIRLARPGDVDALLAIYAPYLSTTVTFEYVLPSREEFSRRIADVQARVPYLVLEEDGQPVGYAYAHHWQPDPVYDLTWELTMYLAHDILGHGLGSRMLERLVDECRRGGAHVLVSCITEGNAPCERMHLRAGFTRAGCIPETGFKFGRFLNDVINYRLL